MTSEAQPDAWNLVKEKTASASRQLKALRASPGWQRVQTWRRESPLVRALAPWWPALPGALLVAPAWATFGGRIIDDAYISLCYAGNLLDGNGLVFHPALERTEGYSNLLWTLLLSGALALGAPGGLAMACLGILFALLAVVAVARHVGGWSGAAAGLAIAASPIYSYWAGGGLEGSLFGFLLTIGILRLGRAEAWLAFGLVSLTRVEGVAWGALPVAHALLTWPTSKGRRPRAWWPLLWLGPFLGQLAFRQLYYQSLTPATVLAKVGTVNEVAIRDGLSWLQPLGRVETVLCVALPIAAVLLGVRAIRSKDRGDPGLWAVVAVAGGVVFGVLVGGDWMPTLRLLQPIVPLAWLAVGRAFGPRLGVVVGTIGLVVGIRTAGVNRGVGDLPRQWGMVSTILKLGPAPAPLSPATLFVLEHTEQDDPILMPDLGQLAWVTGNPTLDPQGLTWRSVAEAIHEILFRVDNKARKNIRQTIRTMRPAVIGLAVGGPGHGGGPVAAELLDKQGVPRDEWFQNGWTEWTASGDGTDRLKVFVRNDATPERDVEVVLARLREAKARAPEAAAVAAREIEILRLHGREEEAGRLVAEMDPRWHPNPHDGTLEKPASTRKTTRKTRKKGPDAPGKGPG